MKQIAWFFALLISVAVARGAARAPSMSPLERDFLHPPASARPWVYWIIMDGTLTREGITADFEAMHKAGIGGLMVIEVNLGLPRGPVGFMSPEWQELFVHAENEARRLGLEIGLNAGPGWCGSGGPWISPDQSMQHLVASELTVKGPQQFQGELPRPQPRPPFFGPKTMTPELTQEWKDFYRDVRVIAFPTPRGNLRLDDVDEKALYRRAPFSSVPGVKPFLPMPAHFLEVPSDETVQPAAIVDLTSRLGADGHLDWTVPPGDWTILRFGRVTTGQTTRPAPASGLGFESDKFSVAAVDNQFAHFPGPFLKGRGPESRQESGVTMLHFDSWEMSAQNWSPGFAAEFKQRRGYDLWHWLPALTGRIVENRDMTERFLWDLRQTAQELVVAHHILRLKELGREHGLQFSIEPYDMNPNADLTLGAAADVPIGEFWWHCPNFNADYSVIEAVSIGHTNGRRIIGAEAFTSDPGEDWRGYPGSVKGLGDWAFCAGINRFYIHRYTHQPSLDRRPGMMMWKYGVHWERTQTWWPMAGACHEYFSRCQQMLRQGLPVADILYLAGEGAPQVFRPPPSATNGNRPDRLGHNFDGCAPETLLESVTVKDGRLCLPDGMSYALLELPYRATMTPRLLRKVDALVREGATVVGPRPMYSPSLEGYPACDEDVRRLADGLWGPCDGRTVKEHAVGRGRVIWDADAAPQSATEQYGNYGVAARALAKMGIAPDFESDGPVRYTHRRMPSGELYFVSNREARVVEANCVFRVDGLQPELWDPVTGERRLLKAFRTREGRTTIPMRFEPEQAFFVVFRHAADEPAGKMSAVNFAGTHPVQELQGPWSVAFDPKWGGPAAVEFPVLENWIQRPETGIRHYSGIAVYRKRFEFKPGVGESSRGRLWLDLGVVKNIARVRLNGRELGVVWCAPWRVDVTESLRRGMNELEIEVANLWPNRLIGDLSLPESERFTWASMNLFTATSPLLDSGLLGPVTLQAADRGDASSGQKF